MKLFIPCIVCGKKAKWSYMPSTENYCDNHVPRGCSCNHDEDGTDTLDEQGRKQPCCEYFIIHEPEHDNEQRLREDWEEYYKIHPEQELEEFEEPVVRPHFRRDKLIARMPDWKAEKNARSRQHKSKPKGFKPNRKIDDFS